MSGRSHERQAVGDQVLEVPDEAVLADPAELDHDEGDGRERRGDRDVAGRGGQSRDQAEEVAAQDEEERRQQIAQVAVGAVGDRLLRHLVADEQDQHLEQAAQPSRDRVRGTARRQAQHEEQHEPRKPDHHHVLGDREVEPHSWMCGSGIDHVR